MLQAADLKQELNLLQPRLEDLRSESQRTGFLGQS